MKALTPKQREFLARCIGNAHAAIAGGQHAAAIGWWRKTLEVAPDLPEAWYNLGLALAGQARRDEAKDAFLKAAALAPDVADAQSNIGLQLLNVGALAPAEQCLRRALALAPDYAYAHSNLGLLRKRQNRLGEAIAAFERALALQPRLAAVHANLGGTLNLQRNYAAGEAACRKALAIDGQLAAGWGNLGSALAGLHRLDEAEAACRKAIALEANLPEPHAILAHVLIEKGAYAEALGEFDASLAKDPDNCETFSSRLFYQNYVPDSSPADMLAAARRYEKVAARNATRFTNWKCVADPGRRLRVGLVSGDFRRHPVGYLLQGPLRELDREGFELHAYSNHDRRDDLSAELASRCTAWNEVVGVGDAELAQRIHADAIDILVDLAGHTNHGRLPVFAWKPAPVQVAWLGYFATTGLAAIDWKIGDPWMCPPGEESHFTERIWRLPDSCFCFSPPGDAPEVADLPCKANGFVTYGCFNTLNKINDAVIALWSRILNADATARLFVKAKQLAGREPRESLVARFGRHGIAADRLILEEASPHADYLAAYGRVDIALDPFPYPGGMTTAECLWMGVPVVTLKGDRFIAHQGESLLQAAGLPEWVATTQEEYVAIALGAASARDALASARAGLREKVAHAPLFDAARYARNLESAWRGMWREWCENRG